MYADVSNDVAPTDPIARVDGSAGQVGVRGSEPTVVDGHSAIPDDDATERHPTIGGGTYRFSDEPGDVDAPVSAVPAGWMEAAYDLARDRRSEADARRRCRREKKGKDSDDENHGAPSPSPLPQPIG